MSYIEIYNEQVRDLLVEKSENLMLIEDPLRGIVVPDLTEYEINSLQELDKHIISGNQRRVMASTGFNAFSSRSHALISLNIEKKVFQ